ncbi:hypothetical protein [Amycolatopsis panacis]|nr:hypothetical protein [Amycolatopsis panacis]
MAEVLDRVDEHPDFDPREHYELTVTAAELTAGERGAATSAGEIDLDLP